MEETAVDKHQTPIGRTATALLVAGIILIVGGFALRIFAGNSADIDQMSGVGDPSGALTAVAIGTVALIIGGLALVSGIVLRVINR
jgi:uncharacterized membrane protein YphA (DoxX/SURF4 family)